MAHIEQKNFCNIVKIQHPNFFKDKSVLDVGSLDINGNNRYLFDNCTICGIDVGAGSNVDVVSTAHEFNAPDQSYDVIISTECFEHDMHYAKSLNNIVRMLKNGGLFLFTCATTGRPEHGTKRTTPGNAPLLPDQDDWSNYYKNITEDDVKVAVDIDMIFAKYSFEVNRASHDLYFWGIKK